MTLFSQHEARASRPSRLASIDALRGLVMLIMALDHVRDFFHEGAMSFSPDDLKRTTAILFMTRWVTHLCAPVFIFTTGIGAFLWGSRPGRTPQDLSRFLLTRGLWLIILELTVLRLGYFFSLTSSPWLLTILWVIGGSMIALSVLVHLPVAVLAPVSLAVICLHNLADAIKASPFGAFAPIWNLLHQPGAFRWGGTVVVVAYPFIPWIAVMSAGYCFGRMFQTDPARRHAWFVRLGLGAVALFLALRSLNLYGDPRPWSSAIPEMTALSFLNTTKYPPSVLFLLMTLGPALLLLAWFDGRPFRPGHPLLVVGRVPLFFFLAHFWIAHLLAVPFALARYGEAGFLLLPMPSLGGAADGYPPGYGYSLPSVYAIWLLVLALVYPLCRWFAGLKQRRTDWWLGYL